MADILKPDLIWIEGRCYRLEDKLLDMRSNPEEELYENEAVEYGEIDEDDTDIEVKKLESGRYSAALHVASPYIGAIIGTKGAVIKRMESETKAEIKIPKRGDVQVLGPTVTSVRLACQRISNIVVSSRFKRLLTHFISIPMNNTNIKENFEKFKAKVMEENPELDEKLFSPPEKLHLTIGIMTLMDDEERLEASKILFEAKSKILLPLLDKKPLKIKLKGVSYFNDDPSAVTVLFGTVEEEDDRKGLLQKICDEVFQCFARKGYMSVKRGNTVKMHVTLMNSRFLYDDDFKGKCMTFDVSKILKEHSDYEFGLQDFTCLHLSQRHTLGEDGYYQPTCVVNNE